MTDMTIAQRNLAVLRDRLGVSDGDRPLTLDPRCPFILLGDATAYGASAPVVYLDSRHLTRVLALAAIADDGVNPLPRVLVDLNAHAAAFTALEYDRVSGMSTGASISLLPSHPDDQTDAESHYATLPEAVMELLGHYDD